MSPTLKEVQDGKYFQKADGKLIKNENYVAPSDEQLEKAMAETNGSEPACDVTVNADDVEDIEEVDEIPEGAETTAGVELTQAPEEVSTLADEVPEGDVKLAEGQELPDEPTT